MIFNEGNRRTLRDQCGCIYESPIAVAIVMVFLFCFAFFLTYPPEFHGLSTLSLLQQPSQTNSSVCASLMSLNLTKSDIESLIEYTKKLLEYVNALKVTLERTTQERDIAQNMLATMVDDRKVGSSGDVKASQTNPIVTPDEFLNPGLSKMLEEVAVKREVLVVLVDANVRDKLEIWFSHVKRVGIPNYLVIALDDDTVTFCTQNDVRVYKWDPDQEIGKSKYAGSISGLKFRVLRNFLQLGYAVIVSDVDVVHLQNPFDHLYRDSDVESMTDGHDNRTAYGYIEVFHDPDMGWSSSIHTTWLWVFNSAYFYLRPTKPSIELLHRVSSRLDKDPGQWDQDVYNEELFFPSHPGYGGLHAAKRAMDIYQFMNSKVLFKYVRKDPVLRKLLPIIVHVNYHPDKFERMRGVVDFYVNGNQTALDPFTDGTH